MGPVTYIIGVNTAPVLFSIVNARGGTIPLPCTKHDHALAALLVNSRLCCSCRLRTQGAWGRASARGGLCDSVTGKKNGALFFVLCPKHAIFSTGVGDGSFWTRQGLF